MPPEIRRIGKTAEAAGPAAFRRIAACLDGSAFAERVVSHALAVARALGAPVTLLRVIEGGASGEPPADPLAWDLRRKEAAEYLARLAEGRGDERAPLDAEVIEGNVAEQICLWALHHDADLTVLASHGLSRALPSGRSPALPASSSSAFRARCCSFPPTASRRRKSAPATGRILVPLDGSLRAESVLPLATRLATAYEAELAARSRGPGPRADRGRSARRRGSRAPERLVRRNERVANEYLDRMRARLAAGGLSVRAVVLRGGDAAAGWRA